jgi:hypothetical protein
MANEIVAAIAALKAEREASRTRIAEIDAQLAEIAGTLPRRRRVKDEPVKARAPRKVKGSTGSAAPAQGE